MYILKQINNPGTNETDRIIGVYSSLEGAKDIAPILRWTQPCPDYQAFMATDKSGDLWLIFSREVDEPPSDDYRYWLE